MTTSYEVTNSLPWYPRLTISNYFELTSPYLNIFKSSTSGSPLHKLAISSIDGFLDEILVLFDLVCLGNCHIASMALLASIQMV